MTQLNIAQEYDQQRIDQLENELTAISTDVPGLSEKLNIELQQSNLSTFLLGISEIHKINIDVNPELQNTQIINNFKDVEVLDVLSYVCKIYNLTIDFTGNILYITPYQKEEIPENRAIEIQYDPTAQILSVDLKNDNLSEVFKLISNTSGKGIFYTPELANKTISGFIKDLPFAIAMEKIAYSNDLIVSKTKDGSFEFTSGIIQSSAGNGDGNQQQTRPIRARNANFFFKVIDKENGILDVDIQNVPIADIIYDVGNELGLDIFTASPLNEAGFASVSAKNISFDSLLTKIFENTTLALNSSQNSNNQNNNGRTDRGQDITPSSPVNRFTFKKENGVYYFGTYRQLTLRSAEVIPLRYRSIGLLSDPQRSGRSAGRSNTSFGFNSGFRGNGSNVGNTTGTFNPNQQATGQRNLRNQDQDISDISSLIPDDVKQDLNIIADKELNSFIVSGASADIGRFKRFVKEIDKQVPIVIVEVMILEVNKNSTLDTGIEWGIGSEPTTTQGAIFPETNINLGASTINRILGRIDGSSFFNIGQVGPNFFANIRASESNGNFKIKSSPRITTLNGHRAYFSNGQTSYFEVTQNQFVGTQNPILSESVNFVPVDAELSLEVLPFVSADGEVTMDIKVIQSSFNGERVTENGPPEISSREFTSIIKSRTNDIVVLGGLEENRKSNSGSGVPFLARIPIIKFLFSKRVRTASTSKLTVLIKPTVIY
ncbi:general secretion pathway protein GspD [uncultured Dokdonia sp.]|uniref:type II secretion system protein GspD n=1 Tax=uncultured Dokdonia sp. TaxID=575653 RepID=UPI0026315F68|nr:general secretion pathway protein GspD [uncultured Dokdonia sp.]